jgi:hypothetical protein
LDCSRADRRFHRQQDRPRQGGRAFSSTSFSV